MSLSASEAVVVVRPAEADDRAAIHSIVDRDAEGATYAESVRYFLGLAFAGASTDCRAVVADVDGVVGIALFGPVAGAVGTGRLHFIGVSDRHRRGGIGSRLCSAAVAEMVVSGARLVVVEIADDASFAAGRALLVHAGFREVARVADYYRDGVDLLVLQYRA